MMKIIIQYLILLTSGDIKKMTQPFIQQNIKKRISVLVFIKGSSAPLVLYVENPYDFYKEILNSIKTSATTIKLIETDTLGPIKKVSFLSNQIAAVAIQEEQHLVK